jgi:hypothetical protein
MPCTVGDYQNCLCMNSDSRITQVPTNIVSFSVAKRIILLVGNDAWRLEAFVDSLACQGLGWLFFGSLFSEVKRQSSYSS